MTIKEWIDTLPGGVREKALANTLIMQAREGSNILNTFEPDLYHALSGAFYWEDTPEGHNYWSAYANAARAQKATVKEVDEDNS